MHKKKKLLYFFDKPEPHNTHPPIYPQTHIVSLPFFVLFFLFQQRDVRQRAERASVDREKGNCDRRKGKWESCSSAYSTNCFLISTFPTSHSPSLYKIHNEELLINWQLTSNELQLCAITNQHIPNNASHNAPFLSFHIALNEVNFL